MFKAKVDDRQLRASLTTSTKTTISLLRKGVILAGYFLQRKSQQIVPVKYGVLKNTARTNLDKVRTKGSKIVVHVSYGTVYGIYVHENMEAQHNRPPNAQAKFLTGPLIKHRDHMTKIVSKVITSSKT